MQEDTRKRADACHQRYRMITVAGFLAEVGDVRRFESPRQIQKLAGLSLRENSSGKHKGQTTISKEVGVSCGQCCSMQQFR